MDNQPPVAFETLLRHARVAAGLTQEALAEQAGLSTRVISDIERGIIRAPQRGTLEMLAQALGLDPQERELWAATRMRASRRISTRPAARGHSAAEPVSNLPEPTTSLVGREAAVTEVVGLLRNPATRLLTLTGPGGVGKTRLALATARAAHSGYPDGTIFVDLVPVLDSALVVSTMAAALGVVESADQTVADGLTTFLRTKHMLLVLDNVEQVVDAASQITALLRECPNLDILATSRVPLQVQMEQRYPVTPLETTSQETATPESVLASDAGTLFVQRTRVVRPNFQVTTDNASAVAGICSRLDGLPLAIELAASRMAALSATVILRQLDDRFNLLSDGPRDLPERQRALLATIDWSYSLLGTEERRLFVQCAVFAGGWQLDAIEGMGERDADQGTNSIGTLLSLVKQSLVTQREQPDGEIRFDMLESVREFGRWKAREDGEEHVLRSRHADWVTGLVEQHAPLKSGADLIPALNRIEAEHANISAALDWSISSGDATTGWTIAANVWLYWWMRNHLREGRRQYARLLALPSHNVPPRTLAGGLTGAGVIAEWLNDPDEATRLQQSAIEIWSKLRFHERIDEFWSQVCLHNLALRRGDLVEAGLRALIADEIAGEHHDVFLQAMSASNQGGLLLASGDVPGAKLFYREALDYARRSANPWAISLSLGNLVNAQVQAGETAGIEPLIDEVIAISRDMGNAYQILWGLDQRSEYAILSNRLTDALVDIEEALELARWFGNSYVEVRTTLLLGDVLARLGRIEESFRAFSESLNLAHAHDYPELIAATLDGLAHVLATTTQLELATRIVSASHALRASHGLMLVGLQREQSERLIALLRSELSDDAFASEWTAGLSLSRDGVVTLMESIATPRRPVSS